MSQSLNLQNFSSLNILARTTLTNDLPSGTTTLSVGNATNFASGAVLVGSPENQTSELATLSSTPTATSILLVSSTRLPHNNTDAVLLLFGTYLRVYTAADVSGGTGVQPPDANFTPLVGGTIPMDASRPTTAFSDNISPGGTWYKYTYYNPLTATESALSSSAAVQSGQFHYVSLDQVRRAASLPRDTRVSDGLIAEYRDAAEREVSGALQSVYQLPLPQPTNPIIVQIVKNIAAGELMQEVYSSTSPQMAALGVAKANHGRVGDGNGVDGLAQLVNREVVLQDGNFVELVVDEAHAFGGYPDDTTAGLTSSQGGDGGHYWTVNKVY